MAQSIDEMAAALQAVYGSDPQSVGVEDGTEDDWGDLIHEAATMLGVDTEEDDQWQHFQDVAMECRATTMDAWLAHLQAAGTR